MQITMAMPPVNRTRELYFAGLIFVVCQSTVKSAKIGPLENFTLYGRWIWDFGLLPIILIHIHMYISMVFYPFPAPLPPSPPYSLSVHACIGIHACTHMHAHMHMHVNIHTHTTHTQFSGFQCEKLATTVKHYLEGKGAKEKSRWAVLMYVVGRGIVITECHKNERHWSAKPSAQQCMWLYLCVD